MMDVNKQIDYWITTADDDLNSAELLVNGGKYLHGLFFCHLCIEKAIKAHVVKCTNQLPPRIHNLALLASKTDLTLSEEDKNLCAILMNYLLEGRYPEHYPSVPSYEDSIKYLAETKKLFQWLRTKL
jgi:HEPN domain-containing protein